MPSLEASIGEIKRSLGGFCLGRCPRTCCDFSVGHLILTDKEVGAVFREEINRAREISGRTFEEALEEEKINLVRINILRPYGSGGFILKGIECPHHDALTNKCAIHSDPDRPAACLDFPIYLSATGIHLDGSCPYILDHYEAIVDRLEAGHGDEIEARDLRFKLWIEPPDFEFCYNGLARDNYDLKQEPDMVKELVRALREESRQRPSAGNIIGY